MFERVLNVLLIDSLPWLIHTSTGLCLNVFLESTPILSWWIQIKSCNHVLFFDLPPTNYSIYKQSKFCARPNVIFSNSVWTCFRNFIIFIIFRSKTLRYQKVFRVLPLNSHSGWGLQLSLNPQLKNTCYACQHSNSQLQAWMGKTCKTGTYLLMPY